MQAKEDDFKVGPHLLILPGVMVGVTIAFLLIACLYAELRDRKVATLKMKYANWTDQDGLLPEFSEKEVNPGRRNPLHIAIQVKNLPLVKKLVEGSYQKCDHIDRDGLYALHFAAASQSMEMIKYIAEHTPKDFRPQGHSPLHVAARNEDFNALGYLIENFPELQKNIDWSKSSYLEVLCVKRVGVYSEHASLKCHSRYGEFIHKHRRLIPHDLFVGSLTPYRDFSQDQVAIEMQPMPSENVALLKV